MVAFEELERLIGDLPAPYELTHLRARRLVLKGTEGALTTVALASAIENFHAHLEYLTFCCETYGLAGTERTALAVICVQALEEVRSHCDQPNS